MTVMTEASTPTGPTDPKGPVVDPTSSDRLVRVVRSELFKLRTTSAWWLFTAAILVSTTVMVVVDCVNAHGLLKPFADFVILHSHDPGDAVDPGHIAHLKDEWTLGHSSVTQAVTIYTANQLIGLLLVCLLGIVLVTTEFAQQTATSTFLITPRRGTVLAGKMIAAVLLAVAAWFAATVLSVVAGAIFLHSQGVGTHLGEWSVQRAILLNLAAYLLWAVFGIGFGALIRNQLVATVAATVLYLIGAAAAGTLFDLINTYLIAGTWVLGLQVIAPAVASQVMISPTALFTGSPPQWVGAAVLIAYSALFVALGLRMLRRSDIG
jgi:ABC-type transport system involved in multi-copper enzyme maturation permease subunit